MSDSGVRVTVLVENRAARPELGGEHGFAAMVESPGGTVLFDTGASDLVARNARALGLDLSGVDAVALSHGHYDHTGGLPAVLAAIRPEVRIFAHPAAFERKYAVRPGKPARSIGVPEVPAGGRLSLAAGPREIMPGVTLMGQVPRVTAYEDTGGPFFLDPEGTAPDFLVDDTSLLVSTPAGPVLITGCAHAGIVNTLRRASELSGDTRFAAVLGGTHLMSASQHRLERTVSDLGDFDVAILAPVHCTGEVAAGKLRRACGERYRDCPAGTVLAFPEGN